MSSCHATCRSNFSNNFVRQSFSSFFKFFNRNCADPFIREEEEGMNELKKKVSEEQYLTRRKSWMKSGHSHVYLAAEFAPFGSTWAELAVLCEIFPVEQQSVYSFSLCPFGKFFSSSCEWLVCWLLAWPSVCSKGVVVGYICFIPYPRFFSFFKLKRIVDSRRQTAAQRTWSAPGYLFFTWASSTNERSARPPHKALSLIILRKEKKKKSLLAYMRLIFFLSLQLKRKLVYCKVVAFHIKI